MPPVWKLNAAQVLGLAAAGVAIGGTFERMGVRGATAAAMASATFGITVAGLIAGYIGGWLIRRHRLKSAASETAAAPRTLDKTAPPLLNLVLAIAIAMGIGN